MQKEVKQFLDSQTQWKDELTLLRDIAVSCGLKEEIKWKHPCFTDNGKNIVLIHGFKEYCAMLFPKGALLSDPKHILIAQTENVQSGRQVRFTSVKEIETLRPTLVDYINESIQNERKGKKIKSKTTSDYRFPKELEMKFEENPELKTAFYKLTPGRQRGYLLHFSSAKNSQTILDRIDKNTHRILNGYGFNDCICSKSKRMPNCDGSHKE